MKKIRFISLAFILLVLLAACSGTKEVENVNNNGEESEHENAEEDEGGVEIDKGLLNVEVTLPASFFENMDIDDLIAEAKENGVKEVIENDDGSLTYKMTRSKHKKMVADMEESVIETMEEVKSDEEFTSIKDVSANKSFSEFTLVVDQAAYEESFDGFAVFGLAISGMYYQLFEGVDTAENKVTILVKDEETGKVFDEVIYPDALEE